MRSINDFKTVHVYVNVYRLHAPCFPSLLLPFWSRATQRYLRI